MTSEKSVDRHFEGCEPHVRSTYDAILNAARSFGAVREDAKKTSIHLIRSTAFAGVSIRKAWLILTLKSAVDIKSRRITRHEQASAHRWHLEVKLAAPEEVDRELMRWMKAAYDLAG
jgi:uncharacterized protein DUF5655